MRIGVPSQCTDATCLAFQFSAQWGGASCPASLRRQEARHGEVNVEKPKQIIEAQNPATRGSQLQLAKPETEKCQGAIGPSELPWDAAADTTFRFAVLGACFEAQQRVTGER